MADAASSRVADAVGGRCDSNSWECVRHGHLEKQAKAAEVEEEADHNRPLAGNRRVVVAAVVAVGLDRIHREEGGS